MGVAGMTIPTITDEMLAEIAREFSEHGCLDSFNADDVVSICVELLTLRAELESCRLELSVGRNALEKLARVPGCGCSFPCRCGGEEWTKAELEGRMDFAGEALATMQEQDK